MDPEAEDRLVKEIHELISGFLAHKIRESAGEYAGKIRIDMFFYRDSGRKAHYIEVEQTLGPKTLKEAEMNWLEYEKEKLVREAAKFMTGSESNK